jgi:hypothetical protein
MRLSYLQFVLVIALASTAVGANPLPSRTVYDATLKNGFSIHHLRHETVGPNTRLYTDKNNYIDIPTSEILEMAESQETLPAPPEELKKKPDLNEVVSAASTKHRIDADLITSVIHAESDFNPKAVSPKGAQGLMQLMPGTAARLGVLDAFDPFANVDAGTQYLRDLLVRYNGDMAKALAAYNAGPSRVQQYGGVPPYRETRAYVAHIIKEFNQKKLAQKATLKTADNKASTVAADVKGK